MYEKIFNQNDDGCIGKAFECAIKEVLKRKNADVISPAGACDFIFNHKHYEVKQNGGVAKYDVNKNAFVGSKTVIYATHIANTIINNGDGTITVCIDLENTEFFVLDRQTFFDYLVDTNGLKVNASRGTVNIQTMYNYSKNAYHGARGKKLEVWARQNQINDNIIDVLFDRIYIDQLIGEIILPYKKNYLLWRFLL